MVRVRLSDFEVQLARQLGQLRNAQNVASGVRDRRFAKDPERIHFLGACAELAFAKRFHCYPDLSPSPRSGGFDTWIRSDGHRITVDVKHSENPNARLITHINKSLAGIDFYVLVTGTPPVFDITGYASAQEFLLPDNILDLGYGPTYALDQSALHEFKE